MSKSVKSKSDLEYRKKDINSYMQKLKKQQENDKISKSYIQISKNKNRDKVNSSFCKEKIHCKYSSTLESVSRKTQHIHYMSYRVHITLSKVSCLNNDGKNMQSFN